LVRYLIFRPNTFIRAACLTHQIVPILYTANNVVADRSAGPQHYSGYFYMVGTPPANNSESMKSNLKIKVITLILVYSVSILGWYLISYVVSLVLPVSITPFIFVGTIGGLLLVGSLLLFYPTEPPANSQAPTAEDLGYVEFPDTNAKVPH
jgi:hypothetical protein